MKAIVSEKGQVTLPKRLRDKLGLSQGTVIDFEDEKGCLVGRKLVEEDPFTRWRGRGRLPKGQSVDEYLRRSRGDYRR